MRSRMAFRLVVAALVLSPLQSMALEREAVYERLLDFPSLVQGGTVTPVWMADGSNFTYVTGTGSERKVVRVDAASGKTQLADPAQEKAPTPEETTLAERLKPRVTGTHFPASGRPVELPSPKGDLLLRVENNNLWIRNAVDGRSWQLTNDGVDRFGWSDSLWPYAASEWSTDGHTIAAFKADARQVHYMPVTHWLKRSEEVTYHMYAPAGGTLPHQQLFFIDVPSGARVGVEMGEDAAYFRSAGWHPNGQEFLCFWLSRDGKRVELRAAHRATGAVRLLWADDSATFVASTMLFLRGPEPAFKMLSDGRFIVGSERSGWRHLYLYGPGKSGKAGGASAPALQVQLTKGAFPIYDIVHVDERRGLVYFTAHSDQQRAYDTHLMRVGLNGSGLKQLTDATGQHEIQMAPSGDYFLDTHSSVSRPPSTELRRADGTRVAVLETANIAELRALGWQPPEEVVVKAADGKTDLYAVVNKPWNLDASKKYPVIEYLYGGPQTALGLRSFIPLPGQAVLSVALAQLGYVTFTVDARGTPARSKAFQDVVYGNWGRNEIADHAAALRATAQARPFMDMDRVGVYGHSYGGYYTTRAMLQAPDLYKVGVASAPASHLSSIFALASENYMGGRPQDAPEAYEYASNLRLVDRLQGKFLIIHPTSDVNAPFAHGVQLIQALIRAGKHYDFNILPEADHGFSYEDSTRSDPVWSRTVKEYFVEHLPPR